MKTQIYSFKITYEGCAKKIWRTAEVSSNYDLAKLGYLILATFDTLAYHLFEISYNGQTYSLDSDDMGIGRNVSLLADTKLSSLNLTKGSQMKMIYDFGCNQEFDIKLISVSDMASGSSTEVSGCGASMALKASPVSTGTTTARTALPIAPVTSMIMIHQ